MSDNASETSTSSGDPANASAYGFPHAVWRGAKWISLGRFGGIRIAADAGLLILILAMFVLGLMSPTPGPRIVAIGLVLASVVIHELGHAAMARLLGVTVGGVYLHIVSFASIDTGDPQSRDVARKTCWIALAGPLASLLVAGLCLCLGARFDVSGEPIERVVDLPPLDLLLWVNAAMGGINLLPALPVDGGRAIDAQIRPRVSLARRRRILIGLGMGVALLLGWWGSRSVSSLRLPVMLLALIFLLAAIRLFATPLRRR